MADKSDKFMPSGAIPIGYMMEEDMGKSIRQDASGRGQVVPTNLQAPTPQGASMSGPTPRYSVQTPIRGMGGTVAGLKPKAQRQMTPEEMSAMADAMLAKIQADHAAAQKAGPAEGTRNALDRSSIPPEWLSKYMGK